ncbi:MAG: transposase [Promethearchaeota archaeon]
MPDHVHGFISISPTTIVRILKGVTARQLFKPFPHLDHQYFWGGHLWRQVITWELRDTLRRRQSRNTSQEPTIVIK